MTKDIKRFGRDRKNVAWHKAPDIKKRVNYLIEVLKFTWVEPKRIYCFRSFNSKSKAFARIWGLSKVWQKALKKKPSYIIEVLSEKFDRLPRKEQEKVLIHELAHIPKNFSGSLLPHLRTRGKRNFQQKVKNLFHQYLSLEVKD